MKRHDAFFPEPPPPGFPAPWITLTFAGIVTALGFILYACYRQGMIDGWPFGAAVLFLIAVSTGGVAMIGMERQQRRNSQNSPREVPPPPDVYTVWPPAHGTDASEPTLENPPCFCAAQTGRGTARIAGGGGA